MFFVDQYDRLRMTCCFITLGVQNLYFGWLPILDIKSVDKNRPSPAYEINFWFEFSTINIP